MEANQYLNDFYNHYDEDSRLLFQHGSVEFLTTMRYIEKYLKHGDKVLEIGAGTGRYSHALARRGHPVDAVELVAHNIEVFRQNTRPGESVTIAQGNALDLSAFADNAYDVTLLLGPLYHLYTQDDKRRALRSLKGVVQRHNDARRSEAAQAHDTAAQPERPDLFVAVPLGGGPISGVDTQDVLLGQPHPEVPHPQRRVQRGRQTDLDRPGHPGRLMRVPRVGRVLPHHRQRRVTVEVGQHPHDVRHTLRIDRHRHG